MKKTLILVSIFAGIISVCNAQNCEKNFEGIIKYATSYETKDIKDTLFVYFGKDKIRIERKGNLPNQYGEVTDEYFDFTGEKNVGYYFSTQMGLKQVVHSEKKIKTLDIFKDSTAILLDQNCFKVNHDYHLGYYLEAAHHMQKTIWVSDELCYDLPEGWDYLEAPIFANGTGKIGLKVKQKFHFDDPYNQTSRTTVSYKTAFEIIPKKISDSILEIPK